MSDLNPRIELRAGGAWQDITSDVYRRDGVEVTRGRPDEGSKTDPGNLALTIDNRTGRYSPRNPESDLYGQLGRNTPIRVRQGPRRRALALYGSYFIYASTPHTAAMDITGDLDVRIEIEPHTWRPVEFEILAAKVLSDTDRSWALRLLTDGSPELSWDDGTTRTALPSTVPIAADTGRLALRATLDVSNASGVYELRYYTADTIAGPWTQLGDPVTGSAATSIATSTADLTLGAIATGKSWYNSGEVYRGLIHGFQLRDGIDGTLVSDIGFGDAEPENDTFTDATGLTWTLHTLAHITDPSIRMVGEVAAWPPRWSTSGADVYTPIEGAGILRRLGNAASPLRSVLRRGTVTAADVVAYWPLEDGADSVSLASGLDTGAPMSIVRTPKLAAFDGFTASEPIPTMQTGQLVGTVPTYPDSNEFQVQFLVAVPDGGIPAQNQILEVRTDGSARRFAMELDTGGSLSMFVYSPTGAVLDDSGKYSFDMNGERARFAIEVTQNGSDVDYTFAVLRPGDSTRWFVERTITGETAGTVTSVRIGGRSGEDLADTAIGHVSVHSTITSIWEYNDETNAYRGESAGRRIERLLHEEGVTFVPSGDLDDTAAMGPQSTATLLDLLRECAEADMGILGELRDRVGLHYRTHASLYNRDVSVTLDYAAGDLAPPLEPLEDDRAIANDVTVKRDGGSSARAVATSGPLSVQAPPEGVGRYDTSVTLNLHADDQVAGQAQWRMHRGTQDELRYPTITVRSSLMTATAERLAALRPGDRVTIVNPPPWLPPGAIDLTVEGTSEDIDPYLWQWQANTSPASVHRVLELDSPEYGRLASDGSELDTAIDATQTSVSVAITAGPLWTTDTGDLPLDILVGGERMRVTGIAGTSSPQTFTVERSVDGITKSHAAGTPVQVADLAVLAIGQSGENQAHFSPQYP